MPINLDQENITVEDMTSNVDAMFSHFNLAKVLESYESTFTSYNFTSSIGSCCIAGKPETNRSTFIKLHDGKILLGVSRSFLEQDIYEYLMLGAKTLTDIVDISSVFNAAKYICNDAGLEEYFIEITAASIYINVRRFFTKESVTQVVDNIKMSEKNSLSQEKVNASTVVPLIDGGLLSWFRQQSRGYKVNNIYQEIVTFDNVQPSELMLRTLNLYKSMWQGQLSEYYSHSIFSGGIYAHILSPDISQKSEVFTDSDDDNQDIMHEYNGAFYGLFDIGMVNENFCCICFVHDHNGMRDEYQIICQRDKKDKRVPPAFIKAVDLYCRLHSITPIDHPFIVGAMMLSASTQQDEFNPEVENIDDWFLNGVINYLAKR